MTPNRSVLVCFGPTASPDPYALGLAKMFSMNFNLSWVQPRFILALGLIIAGIDGKGREKIHKKSHMSVSFSLSCWGGRRC